VQVLKIRNHDRAARLFTGGILHQGIDLDHIGAPFCPQAAATQVGPERTRVRSSTVKRDRADEARWKGIQEVSSSRI